MTYRSIHRPSAVAAAIAIAIGALGVAIAQVTPVEPAAPPVIQEQVQPAAPPAMQEQVQPAAAPVIQEQTQTATPPMIQEPIVIHAPPQAVPQPPGLSGPLSREGVVSEFEAMRAADVLVPTGEVGDTEQTASRREQYHRAETQVWEDYQDRLAAYRAAEAQRAYEAALRAEQQAREAEAAAMEAQTPTEGEPTTVVPPAEPAR